MTLFTSQFDRARDVAGAYAGEAGETRFWVPAAVVGGVAVAGVAEGWGEGWDQGWDAGAPEGEPVAGDGGVVGAPVVDDGGAWSHHGDHTDASVGGDGDFFYFIDGDSSLTIG
ncbi:hypothetical protein FXF51_57375 [Nonomuraea sp. PA05]|uniref:hypothetical protein n=1 Tax=Nonomuraea sp. PA05 TaxID=2604466 RepID=UPI0011D74BCD|nr:hypothetical protein [Nonomuraea sp. PA05]TYB50113.1 hypothetical protein FXF51_57375 [Nonomuraea sp. PA05]